MVDPLEDNWWVASGGEWVGQGLWIAHKREFGDVWASRLLGQYFTGV